LAASAGRTAIRSLSSFEVASDQRHNKSLAFNRFGAAGSVAYVVGTFDTKAPELGLLRQCIEHAGVRVVTVDLSTSGKHSNIGATVNLTAADVAQYHPQGASAVFGNDRGESAKAMAEAFKHLLHTRADLGGIVSMGGAVGAALVIKGMQSVTPGLPKVMVYTGALGDTSAFTGVNDICLMHLAIDTPADSQSKAQRQPLINEQVLGNAAHALVGMMKSSARTGAPENPRTNSRTSPANLTS
jgi:uncharacterized protein (UPF0261 family)